MFASISRRALAALVLGSLAACGGGGGYGGGSPAPAPTYTIGGSVSGLAGTGLVLQNNGGANLTITGNGAFTFATALTNGSAYNVTAVTQPTNLSQTCTIATGSGAVAGANVTNIAVTCATNSFTIGGTISGLAGSGLVLIDNGGDELAIAANGAFAFVTRVASGGTYDVRVLTQPSDPVQLCRITSNSGSVANAAITAPAVTCVTQHPRFAYSLDYNDESISLYAVDATTGHLRPRGHARTGVRPVDGVGDGSGKFVYVMNRGSASVSAFAQDGVGGDLTEVAGSPYSTGAPAEGANRISMHPNGRFVYVANGGANNIAAFEINANTGALSAVPGSPFSAGAHPNYVTIDASGAFAYVANRDSHDVYTYRVTAAGALAEVANSRISTGANSAPMVLTLHTNGRFAYVPNTTSDSISVLAVNAATGVLTQVTGSPFAAGVRPGPTALLHPSGRFIYVRNVGPTDGAGSVTAYSINAATGALTQIGAALPIGVNSQYSWMHPTGRFLMIANRGAPLDDVATPGAISMFSIDAGSGALTSLAGASLRPAPFSVSVDSSGRFVYATSATGNLLYSFELNQTTGDLTPLSNGAVITSRDQPISLVAYSSVTTPAAATFSSKFAYVPNAGANTIGGYAINTSSGALNAGSPVASFGDSPRVAAVHPRGRFVLGVNETGTNYVASYAINDPSGALSPAGSTLFTGGQSPAKMTFHPSGRSVYLAHVFSAAPTPNIVSAYNIDPTTGALAPINVGFNGINTFTPATGVAVAPSGRFLYFVNDTHCGWAEINAATGGFAGSNGNAGFGSPGKSALAIDPNGRFAYVAIAVDPGAIETYSIHAHTGVLAPTAAPAAPTGSMPRSIAIDPVGRYLYAANSGDDTISMFAINRTTGALTSIGPELETGGDPVSIAADYSGRFIHVLSQQDGAVLTYAIDVATGALSLIASGAAPASPTASTLAISSDMH
jgi:6-phosphogluconolactonase